MVLTCSSVEETFLVGYIFCQAFQRITIKVLYSALNLHQKENLMRFLILHNVHSSSKGLRLTMPEACGGGLGLWGQDSKVERSHKQPLWPSSCSNSENHQLPG